MYSWCDYTWNPIRGKCPHGCSYCYMKRFKVGDLRLAEKELGTDLGKGNVIFVGSSTDMFAKEVPVEWINRVLLHCCAFDNTYLFQSKNPARFLESFVFPKKTVFGTTIETNWEDNLSEAPLKSDRTRGMGLLKEKRKMISIEPIMDFDLEVFTCWIKSIAPEFVSIGADSKGNNLSEPSWEKTKQLIEELKKFTEVKVKPNLKRLQKQVSG